MPEVLCQIHISINDQAQSPCMCIHHEAKFKLRPNFKIDGTLSSTYINYQNCINPIPQGMDHQKKYCKYSFVAKPTIELTHKHVSLIKSLILTLDHALTKRLWLRAMHAYVQCKTEPTLFPAHF